MVHAVHANTSVDPFAGVAAATPEAPPVKAPASQPQAAAPVSHHVTLSPGAQASQLLHSGQTVSQIAVSLGLTSALVDSYFGITAAAQTAPSTAVATAAVASTKLA